LISILHYLYRKTRHQAIAVLVVLLLPLPGSAQIRDRTEHQRVDQDQSQTPSKKPAKRGPRAIGVIEFLPKGGARLVPIALWIDGRYYDASFYGANPEPMALQPETVYEAMNYGEPTGWFTVTTPKQVNGNWIADGKWKPQTAFDIKMAEQAAKQAKKKASSGISDDSGPPVLRRAPSSGSPETEASSGNPSSSSSPSGAASAASSGSSAPPPSSDDSDRPTLKNSSPSSSTASSRPTLGSDTLQANAQAPTTTPAPTASSEDENDPNRPTLKRGKPAPQPSSSTSATAAPRTNASSAAPTGAAAQPPKTPAAASSRESVRAYPAISDAGTYETRSFLYPMTPADKEERGRPMLSLALDEVRSYNSKRQPLKAAPAKTAPAKASAKTAARPENFVVTDYDLRAFDLDFSNSPTLVLTAKVPAPSAKPATGGEFDYFVTVVARIDINGQAQKIFSSVTDNNHLDAFPRMEIIDAVDADANGRGDLLFRQHSDGGISYALFRVYPYQMVKVFEGGGGM
jgi:hypothetical protein